MHSSLRGFAQSRNKSESEEDTPTYIADFQSLYIPPLKVRATTFEQEKSPLDFDKSPEQIPLPASDSLEVKDVCCFLPSVGLVS